jgi:ABC-type glycerol-3-phosphate transport system permease component
MAHLRWRNRGIFAVLLAIVICGQIWLVPQAIALFWFHWNIALYSFWLVNWIVSALSVVMFWNALTNASRDRADAARMDGCGAWGIFWHVVMPLVRQTLLIAATLIILPMLIGLAAAFAGLSSFHAVDAGEIDVRLLFAGSLIVSAPLIAIFFYARRLTPRHQVSSRS